MALELWLPYQTVVRNFKRWVFIIVPAICIRCSDDTAVKPEEGPLVLKDAYVVGYDQCARYQGRILAIVNPPDTVITYNFPDSVYKFPEEYYLNYLNDCLFPSGSLDSYPVKVMFRPSREEEFSAFICFGNIYTARLSPLIKNKQVVIVSIIK